MSATLRLVESASRSALVFRVGGIDVAEYIFKSTQEPSECPSPYFHPIRTLGGETVTAHRPPDHPWHKGLWFGIADISGENYWGGGTFVLGAEGDGYVQRDNVGTIEHRTFEVLDTKRAHFVEILDWQTSRGYLQLVEERTVRAWQEHPLVWSLEFETLLRNVSPVRLRIGSPSTNGREFAGYCGLTWRGSPEQGWLLRETETGASQANGSVGGAVIAVASKSLSGAEVTLGAAEDAPFWFLRETPYAIANPSIAYWEAVELEPDQILSRSYTITVTAGALDRRR